MLIEKGRSPVLEKSHWISLNNTFAYWEETICIAAVTQNGFALEYVTNQTEAICIAAVTQNGFALEYVINKTEEICIAAVTQDSSALEYVIKCWISLNIIE